LTGDIQVRDSRDSRSVWYHPGCRVELTCNGTVLGYAGILHPAPAEEYEIRRPALVAEIDFSVLFQAHETGRHQSGYESPSVYPDSLFEVSVILPDDAGTEGPADTILSMQRTEIKEVRFLTVYRGQPLPENQKSASYAIRLGRSDRTLEGDELQNILDAVVAELKQSGYDLR
ncbi:MAG: hypothetical protein KDK30_11615, partial [Leptospiraceae bacterium]|nr:hypothetical protein [Leptospiraceae bacterium]